MKNKSFLSILFLFLILISYAQRPVPADTTLALQLFNEGTNLERVSKFDSAMDKIQSAREIYKNTVGTAHFKYLQTEIEIASIWLGKGNTDSAYRIYTTYLPVLKKMDVKTTDLYCLTLGNLIPVEWKKGNLKKALEQAKDIILPKNRTAS